MANNIFEEFDKMSEKIKNLDEKVSKIGDKSDLQEMNEKLKDIKEKVENINTTKVVYIDKEKERFTWKIFLMRSVKEYCWLGEKEDFKDSKKRIIVLSIVLMFVLILSTILTSLAIKSYSTFTLFENIWLIINVFLLIKLITIKKEHNVFSFFKFSIYKEEYDGESMIYIGEVKKRYYILWILNCISGICNTVFVCVESSVIFSASIIIIEILNISLSVLIFKFLYLPFFDKYYHVKMIGRYDNSIEPLVLFWEPFENKIYSEDEYYKKYRFMK